MPHKLSLQDLAIYLHPPEHSGLEKIQGMVVDSIFYREDNGYRVVRVEPDGGGRSFTACGQIGEVDVGEHLELQGNWVNHQRFGTQFNINQCKIQLPNTLDGLQRYLGSGMIKGVGPVFAEKIIKHFAEDTLDVLNHQIHRLSEVKGMGKKKLGEIKSFWAKKDSSRKLMLFLSEQGIGFNLGLKIQKAYGEKALEQIQHHPYSMVEDIHGVGFVTADHLALRIGVAKDSSERIQSCLSYILHKSQDEGHCYLSESELVAKTAELISLPGDQVQSELTDLLRDMKLVKINDVVQHSQIHLLEKRCAEEVIKRCASPPVIPYDAYALAQSQSKDLQLAESQMASLIKLLNTGFSILTGGPGVGKTTLVKVLVKYMEIKGFEPILAAPTGRAAQRMEDATGRSASTLHRLLKYRPDGEEEFAHNENFPLAGRVFIIDEFSMVDIHLFYAFLIALPPRSQVILVGDQDQLPSVGPGRVLGDLIQSGKVNIATLKEVFRQASGSLLVHNSHRIIKGKLPHMGPEKKLNDFYFVESRDSEQTLNIMKRLLTERIPARFGKNEAFNTQVLSPMRKGPLGTLALNSFLQKLLNPEGRILLEGERSLREGDRILQLVNNYDAELYNGDLGRVKDKSNEGLLMTFGDKELVYPMETLNDIALAYACTVHKSQGSEYPIVIMPIYEGHRNMLSLELLYTALTRAKRLCIWIGKMEYLESVLERPSSINRNTLLGERLAAL
ncbi:MAG: ATP-dependent RecD-like DNA helicase [Planctomycetes bacterium]|nr:ATP-dependent RecD-like DNA helicase [Planctomycetota bacterium]